MMVSSVPAEVTRRTRWLFQSSSTASPLGPNSMSMGQYIALSRRGRPSPLKPPTPLPAQVQITPGSRSHRVSDSGTTTAGFSVTGAPKR